MIHVRTFVSSSSSTPTSAPLTPAPDTSVTSPPPLSSPPLPAVNSAPDALQHASSSLSTPPTPTSSITPIFDSTQPIMTPNEVAASTEAVMHNYESSIFIDGLVARAMEWVQHTTDMPWWVTIAVFTLGARILLFPLAAYQRRSMAKLANVKPLMDPYVLKMQTATSIQEQVQARQELNEFYRSKGVSPVATLWGFAQAPVFIAFFFAVRNLCAADPAFHHGGTLWFHDLSVPDPTYILPVITGALFIATVEMGADTGGTKQTVLIKNVMRAFGVAIIPLSMNFASGMLVYWTANNLVTLLQAAFFKIPYICKLFKIPKIESVVPEAKVFIPEVTYMNRPSKNKDAPSAAHTSTPKSNVYIPEVTFQNRPKKLGGLSTPIDGTLTSTSTTTTSSPAPHSNTNTSENGNADAQSARRRGSRTK